MFFFIKLLKKFLKIFNSAAAPWQIALAVFLGTLVGFLPLFPKGYGPAPLGWILVLVAILVNCHLASFLMFLGLGKLISMALLGPAIAIGNQFDGLAQTSAGIPFLHASMWSHTGWLGLTIVGLVLAPILAIVMAWSAHQFRTKLRDRLMNKKKLVTAGKIGGNMILLRITCWFFDI
jgi:uncharacterized protein (TIGR03546 family)